MRAICLGKMPKYYPKKSVQGRATALIRLIPRQKVQESDDGSGIYVNDRKGRSDSEVNGKMCVAARFGRF